MGKIYYLFGKSASGKDSLYRILLEQKDLNLNEVVLYTTRPIRTGEVEGKEYHFISDREADALQEAGRIIEMRAYNTVHGIWKYMTVADEDFDPDKGDFLMVGTLESFASIRNYFGADKVMPLYVFVDDGERLQRALLRERSQAQPKYAEMCRRFLADDEDFAPEKMAAEGISGGFENRNLEECAREIGAAIRKMKNM